MFGVVILRERIVGVNRQGRNQLLLMNAQTTPDLEEVVALVLQDRLLISASMDKTDRPDKSQAHITQTCVTQDCVIPQFYKYSLIYLTWKLSRNCCRITARLGWRSFFSALSSIWRMRSRVT